MKKISFLGCFVLLLAVVFLVAPVAADTIAANSAISQSATVGTAVTARPSVIVTDGSTPLSGISVTFVVESGSGSVTGGTVTTGSDGIATVGSWTLGTTAGTNTLTVTNISLTGSPVTFTATGTAVAISAPTLTGITPSNGYNTDLVSITNLAGSGFTGTPTVVLMKSGSTNITATSVSVVSASQITCSFDIAGKSAGYWNVVITNPDGQSATLTNGFEIKNPSATVTLSSITPNSGVVNNTVTITDLSGSGFLNTATIRLKRDNYNDILGTAVTIVSSTKITGTFDLNNRATGTYAVCVLNDGVTPTCGPAFYINSAAAVNGTIYVKSSPTSSKVFLSSNYQGYTPLTLDNITPGTYTVLVQRAGYNSYSESVKVTAGNTSYVTASLVLAPEETTVTTTVPTTTVTTVKTTAKSTAKVPTPWPSATPTPASPVSVLAILGAVGVGYVVLRKL